MTLSDNAIINILSLKTLFRHKKLHFTMYTIPGCNGKVCIGLCATAIQQKAIAHGTHGHSPSTEPEKTTVQVFKTDFNGQNKPQNLVFYKKLMIQQLPQKISMLLKRLMVILTYFKLLINMEIKNNLVFSIIFTITSALYDILPQKYINYICFSIGIIFLINVIFSIYYGLKVLKMNPRLQSRLTENLNLFLEKSLKIVSISTFI